MTVIAIIGILAGLIIGIAGYASRKADRSKAIAEIERLKGSLEEYRIDKGAYIDQGSATQMTAAIYAVLLDYDSDLVFTDPWGNPYLYKRMTKFDYRLWSLGPDSRDGSDDISSETGAL
jgi:type II secretion system protein G